MQDFLAELQAAATSWSAAEFVAVLLAVAYLLLAIRQNIWCWPCAAGSTAIYIGLFIDARLYMESALNLFYLAMAVYGWQQWRNGGARENDLPVVRWSARWHGLAISLIIVFAAINGYFLQKYSNAVWPYVDSATTWTAIWATFLVARKVLENWWYWLIIDAVSAVIYWMRDLPLTAVLFAVYMIMIPFGMLSWQRSYQRQRHDVRHTICKTVS